MKPLEVKYVVVKTNSVNFKSSSTESRVLNFRLESCSNFLRIMSRVILMGVFVKRDRTLCEEFKHSIHRHLLWLLPYPRRVVKLDLISEIYLYIMLLNDPDKSIYCTFHNIPAYVMSWALKCVFTWNLKQEWVLHHAHIITLRQGFPT